MVLKICNLVFIKGFLLNKNVKVVSFFMDILGEKGMIVDKINKKVKIEIFYFI